MNRWKRIDKYSKYHLPPSEVKKKDFDNKVRRCCKRPTKSGIFVQSKGEQRIADFLFDNKIEFDYDKRITLPEDSEETASENDKPDFNEHPLQENPELQDAQLMPPLEDEAWIRPDFRIKQNEQKTNTIIEFWGKRYSNDKYDAEAERKIAWYKQEGFDLIEIVPTDLPLLEQLLKQDLAKFIRTTQK